MTTSQLTVTGEATAWMSECIDLAAQAARSGNYAQAALIARRGDGVLARAGNTLITDYDPTAHPEMTALRCATRRLASRYIRGAFLVSTLEPCVMCTGAAIWAKLAGIIFGASQDDALAWTASNGNSRYTWRQIRVSCADVTARGEPVLEVWPGVMREECVSLFGLNPR